MPAAVRLNKKELNELIEETEAAGNDATELRSLLAQVPEEEKPRQPAMRRVPLWANEDEETMEERLNREAAYLFPGGLTQEILNMCMDYDGKYNLKELKRMCVEAGLSPNGHKKLLAAKLIARGIK